MFESEFERRLHAVSRVRAGETVVAAARSVGRSEQWLHKWLRRFEIDGEQGLRDRSRAPHHGPAATSAEIVAKVLEVQGLEPLPSLSTIERILRRAGRTARPKRQRSSERHRPRPQAVGPAVVQQSDWVGPRYLARRLAFYSLHTVDVGGGGAAAGQFGDRRMEHAASFMTDVAWPTLGIPRVAQVDNAFALARPRFANPFNVFVRACLLFGVEVVVAPPNELGWMNHVESFNALWQARTIRRHRYGSVEEVAASSGRFIDYYMHRRPHPALTVARNGSRFPAEVIEQARNRLRLPPQGFTLEVYRHRDDRIRLPIARGRLTFLRRVHDEGWIDAGGVKVPVGGRYAGLCVAATVLTVRQRVRVRLDGKVITEYPFLFPRTRRRSVVRPRPSRLLRRPQGLGLNDVAKVRGSAKDSTRS